MSLKYLTIFLLVSLFPLSCKSQEEAFADKLISKFKNGAITSTNIDWEAFEEEVKASLKISKTVGIEKALTLYGNKHTFYKYKGQMLYGKIPYEASKSKCPYPLKNLFKDNKENIAYVNIPELGLSPNLSESAKKTKATKYIEAITKVIQEADKENAIGWVIDLRSNSGGNMWPMLLALRPFFTQETLGYFINGEDASEWRYADRDIKIGWSSSKKRFLNQDINYQLKYPPKKIAVLIGKRTSSSGEATAIALSSIKNMQYFGDHTSGYSTANQTIKMGVEEYLILTSSVMADHQKKEFWEGIQVDNVICDEQELLQRVVDWIKEG